MVVVFIDTAKSLWSNLVDSNGVGRLEILTKPSGITSGILIISVSPCLVLDRCSCFKLVVSVTLSYRNYQVEIGVQKVIWEVD